MSLSAISEILGLFVKTLTTANNKYSPHNSDNLPEGIQMQLSKKLKLFPKSFGTLLKSTPNFKKFEKKMTLILYIFRKFQTAKDMVRELSKNNCFRTSFENQLAKRSHTQKPALQHLYHILSSLSWKLTWKMSILGIFEILGFFVKTLIANDKYSLIIVIVYFKQIKLNYLKKKKSFSQFFPALVKFSSLIYIFTIYIFPRVIEKYKRSAVAQISNCLWDPLAYCNLSTIHIKFWNKRWLS